MDALDCLALGETAIRPGDHVLASNDPREVDDAIGDEARMLYRGRVVA